MPTYEVDVGGKTYEVDAPDPTTAWQWANYTHKQTPSQPAVSTKPAGFSFKDIATAFGQGAVGSTEAIANVAGAGNVVSQGLGSLTESLQKQYSPERQAEMQRQQERMKKAEESGSTWEEIKAGAQNIYEAPLQSVAQGLGSFVPYVPAIFAGPAAAALGLTGRALTAAKMVEKAYAPVVGTVQGAGAVKGAIYDAVYKAEKESGIPEDEARQKADAAQSYAGKNLDQIALGAGLGYVASKGGVEKFLTKEGREKAGEKALLPRVGGAMAEETLTEGAQGGQERLAQNIALQRTGRDVPTFQGVAGQAAQEGIIGGITAGPISAISGGKSKEEIEQERLKKERDAFEEQRKAFAAQQEKTKENLQVPETLALPAPAKKIEPVKEEVSLANPVGNITKEELGPEVSGYVDQYRKSNNLPPLQSYSIEDVKDAMTQVNPEGEKGALDSILTAKTGFSGTEKYTPDDVINAAVEKNIAYETNGFQDFLQRTTGERDLNAMSEPQLYAAFKALSDMKRESTDEQIVLPEGSNASRFTQDQYNKGLSFVTQQLASGEPIAASPTREALKDVTGLKTDRDVHTLLQNLIRNEDLNVTKAGDDYEITSATPVKDVRAPLPKGYSIEEATYEEGELPAGFEITPEGKGKPLTTVDLEAEVAPKIERLTGLRQQEAAKMLENVNKYSGVVKAGQSSLDGMEARGLSGTEAFAKAKAQQARRQDILSRRIQTLMDRIEEMSAPLKAKPVGKKPVTAKKHTLYKDGKALGTFPSRLDAESSMLTQLSDQELDQLSSDTRFGGITDRATKEKERRKAPAGLPVKGTEEGLAKAGVYTKASPEMAELEKKLVAALSKFGLKDVALKVVRAIENNAEGSYEAKLIKIALDASNPIRTMRHEAIHALKELGFFTKDQWRVLEDKAKDEWVQRYLGQKSAVYEGKQMSRLDAYRKMGLSESELLEEAIADAFGDFDVNKAPPGMMMALLNKLRNFFNAMRQALTGAGFESAEDIFGKIEAGKLDKQMDKADKAGQKFSVGESWTATATEEKQAEKFQQETGLMPYLPQGVLDLPIKAPKYSLQKFNPEKHLAFDSTLGVPINKDGTVTVYYHTTKDQSLKIGQSKVIPSEGRNRVYLTNESGGDSILRDRGNFDQPIDGSTVLVYVTPDMLQLDEEYSNGRRDFFIPLAEGDFFNKKMKMQSIQKGRQAAITSEFSYDDHESRITSSIKKYKNATPAERKDMVAQARRLLKKEHNVGSLLSENGKLEKTRIGEYGLDYEGNSVASQGLGMASAQKITEKVSTCPRSAICEGLCLGETSGGNFMFGGIASEDVADIAKSAFRAGPRMMQYLKTEALIINPEAFATVLQAEIDSLKKWSASDTQIKINKETKKREKVKKEIYQPAVRLNVTSDFKPEMFRAVIEGNPDVQFYDYTKLGIDSIAPNHHLTYSSTGFGQIVDGEKVFFKTKSGQYDHNWATMRDRRLNNGENVAMAFSSKSALPKFLVDEETGEKYKVWDGDDYDARFLDPKQPDGKGMIIGLRNKAGNLSEKNATKKTGGFFAQYDPKQDGDTVVVPDQAQFKEKERKVIPVQQQKFSIRDATDMFDPDEVKKSAETKYKSRYKLINMKIDDFLRLAKAGKQDSKLSEATSRVKEGVKFTSIPYLYIDLEGDNLRVTGHEGRHRAMALQQAGYSTMPVEIRSRSDIRWSEQNDPDSFDYRANWPKRILSEEGAANENFSIAMPFTREQAPEDYQVLQKTEPKFSLREAPNTPEFKRWFGDSKVVDKNGKPLVVYHGSSANITQFRTSALGINTKAKSALGGFFFTSSPQNADEYASGMAARRGEISTTEMMASWSDADRAEYKAAKDYRNSLKPKGTRNDDWMLSDEWRNRNRKVSETFERLLEKNDAGANITPVYLSLQNPLVYDMRGLEYRDVAFADLIAKAKEQGQDGVIIRNTYDPLISDVYIAFRDTQIKSAIGNIGTYDPSNPDIRYSLRDVKSEIESLPNGSKIFSAIKRTTTTREQEGFIERITGAAAPETHSRYRQQALDRYDALSVREKQLAKEMGGIERLADSNAHSAALMSDLHSGVTAQVLGVSDGVGGVPVFDKGYTTVSNLNGTVKGPIDIFRQLAAYGDPTIYQAYQFWSAAKRGKRLLAEGKEENITPQDLAFAKELERRYPEFVNIQKDWIKFNNGLVKYMVDTGVISDAMGKEWTKYSDYIPFYRQLDGEKTIGPNIFQSISGVKPPKKLKGSEAPLADFLETVVRNTHAAVQAGMKNVAAQRAGELAVQVGIGEKLDHVATGIDIVTALENGKKVSYRVGDPLFVDAVKSLNIPELPFMSFLTAPANLLRNLVTKDPGFMLANLMRDSISAYVTSGANIKPVVDTIQNFTKAVQNKSPEFEVLKKAGVIGGYDYSQGIKASTESFEKELRKRAGAMTKTEKRLKPVTGIWDFLEKGTEASDAATRIAVYKDTLKQTGNEAEALLRSLEVMNFNRKGSSALIRIVTAGIPFLNARMQGLDVLYRASLRPVFKGTNPTEREKAIQRTFFVRGAMLMGISLMYAMAVKDDPDYESQEEETKDNNWLVTPLGIRIPTPFEVGFLFKTAPERIYRWWASGSDTSEEFAASMKRGLVSTFAFNPVPQAVLPIAEAITNYSTFTMRPIVGQNLLSIDPAYQVGPSTSVMAEKVGEALGVSPMKIDHIYKGYTGTMGMYLVDVMDSMFDLFSDNPRPAKRFEQTPVLKRFLIDPEARGNVTAYYAFKHSVDEAVRTVNFLSKRLDEEAPDYEEKKIGMLGFKQYVSSLDKQMTNLQDQAIMIRSSGMPAKEKRDALLEITQIQNELVSDIRAIRKMAKEK